MISDKDLLIIKIAKPPKEARSIYWVFISKDYMVYVFNHKEIVVNTGKRIACEAVVIDLRYMTVIEDMMYGTALDETFKQIDENTTTTLIGQTMRDTKERILKQSPDGINYAHVKDLKTITIQKIKLDQHHPTQWRNKANAHFKDQAVKPKKKARSKRR